MFLDCDYGKTIVIFEISTLEYVKDKKIKSGTKLLLMDIVGLEFEKLSLCLKLASSNLSKGKDSCKREKILNLGPKSLSFGYYVALT